MKFAVILSGCGVYDGTEIGEAICTLLALEASDISWEALAPNYVSNRHVDHLTQQEISSGVNVLEYSARIVRGQVRDIALADINDYNAVIVPGGFGAVHNLCDFARSDMDYTLYPPVEDFLAQAVAKKYPIGFMCIAPMLIPRLYKNACFTIGNDKELAEKIQQLGCTHQDCRADEIVIDQQHKIVSTPARMLAESFTELNTGISKLVRAVKGLALS